VGHYKCLPCTKWCAFYFPIPRHKHHGVSWRWFNCRPMGQSKVNHISLLTQKVMYPTHSYRSEPGLKSINNCCQSLRTNWKPGKDEKHSCSYDTVMGVIVPSWYALPATAAPTWADMVWISLKDGYNCLFSRWSGLICAANASAAPQQHPPFLVIK
jgi:hypothetical protein